MQLVSLKLVTETEGAVEVKENAQASAAIFSRARLITTTGLLAEDKLVLFSIQIASFLLSLRRLTN